MFVYGSVGDVCEHVFLQYIQEFEESGDPQNHFQALLSLAKEGIEKGKVCNITRNKECSLVSILCELNVFVNHDQSYYIFLCFLLV